MTVSTSISRVDYVGNGGTTSFAIPYRFLQNSDLRFIRTVIATGVATILTLDSAGADGYTVTGAGAEAGGTATLVTAPPSTTRLTILTSIPVSQEISYIFNDPFPAKTHERGLDKLTMVVREQSERIGRGLTLAESVSGVSGTLSTPVALAPIVVNAAGTGFEYGSTALTGDMLLRGAIAATSAGQGSDIVGFRDVLAPAFLKTLSDIKAGEPVSVFRNIDPIKYSGIRAQTNTDNLLSNFTDLLTAMNTAKYGELIVPAGRYNLGAALSIPANVTIRGESRNRTVLKFSAAGTNGVILGQGAEVHNLTVDASGTATSCFFIDTTNSVVIANCTALNAQSHGFALTNSYACQLSNLRAIGSGSRGYLLDPYCYDNELTNIYAKTSTNAGLLIGHGSHGNIVRGLTLIDTGNAALWLHQECYNNIVTDIRISGSTAAAGTPAMLLMGNAYQNTVSHFSIRSFEIGILFRGLVVDATWVAGHTRRNVVFGGTVTGTGAAVAGSAAFKFDSLDSGTTRAEFNRLYGVVATDFQTGILDVTGVGMFDNHIHDIDLSTNITTKWSAATKNARNRIHDIRGYTPYGDLTALAPPAVAATAVAVTNPFAFPAQIYVKGMPAGGQVQINGGYVSSGTSPNDGNGMYVVGPEQTIILNYASGTPSWIWFGL